MSSLAGQGGFGSTGKASKVGNTGYKSFNVQQLTPEQMDLFKSAFGQVGPDSYLSKLAGGDQSLFEELEAPALKQFSGLQGNIASRFSQPGVGARKSSGFQNTMNTAAQDFAGQLQSKRMDLRNQAIRDLHGMSQDLLNQRPYEQFMYQEPEKQSFWQKLIGIGAPAAGAVAGGVFGGPAGAALGGQLGSSFAGSFNGQPYQANYQGIGSLPTKWKT